MLKKQRTKGKYSFTSIANFNFHFEGNSLQYFNSTEQLSSGTLQREETSVRGICMTFNTRSMGPFRKSRYYRMLMNNKNKIPLVKIVGTAQKKAESYGETLLFRVACVGSTLHN